ncbi:MAG: T9SS type A sorting domain-containing protein [Ferruginibacter sp.]
MKSFTKKLCFTALTCLTLHAYAQIPNLSSISSATPLPTVFLDFDGQTVQSGAWQSGLPFTVAPSTFNNAKILEVFNRVSEDYRPFGVNITTDSTKYFAADPFQRIRIIVTPTSAWFPNAGGVAYGESFTWGDNTPGFVFEDKLAYSPKMVSEGCSHESGHSLGLAHQSRYDTLCGLVETYHTGAGTGTTAWAPIMGNSLTKNMTGWNYGPTPYTCAAPQDNLSIITGQNGFTYRPDDYQETMNTNTTVLNPISFNVSGIITTPTDKDAFKITLTEAGGIHIDAIPYSLGPADEAADLDIMMMLYTGAGTLIRTYNPLSTMRISIDTTLSIGTYYIVLDGTGNNNAGNYGSLGSYTLSGFRGALPIRNVALRGNVEKNTHRLSWNIIADEEIETLVLEASDNGSDFHMIMTSNGSVNNFTAPVSKSGITFYRLRANNIMDQSMYSNIVALKTGGSDKLFAVSTLVQQNISVTAPANYSYTLFDANARIIASDKKLRGTGMINVQELPKGMYVLQMMSDRYKQTERIIKQ